MAIDNLAEKDSYTVYVLNGIMYIPHYNDPFHYVSPGYGYWHTTVHYATTLLAAGAMPRQEYLLKRARHEAATKKARAYERARG